MISSLLAFFLGCFFVPALYALVPGFFGIRKLKRPPPVPKTELPVSEGLKEQLKESLKATDDLAWINVIIHRIYFDMIRSYSFEHRIRQILMRNFGSVIGEGLLKGVKITSVNFGFEAPYIRRVRLLAGDELNEIGSKKRQAKGLCACSKGGAVCACCKTKAKTSAASCTTSCTTSCAASCTTSHSKTTPSHTAIDFDTLNEDTLNFKEIYANATFTGRLEYNGAAQVMIQVELQRGINVNATITLKKLVSDFLFRVPAVGYNTRYELSFINSPEMDVDVCSGLVTDRRLYFQNSISNFLKRVTVNSLKSSFFYPYWVQGVLPFVSGGRLNEFVPEQVTVSNLEGAVTEFEKILLMTSMDFKVVGTSRGVTHRRSYGVLNGVGHVEGWTFGLCGVRERSGRGAGRGRGSGEHYNGSVRGSGEHSGARASASHTASHHSPHANSHTTSSHYEGLTHTESALLASFESLDALRPVIPGLVDALVTYRKGRLALVKAVMKGYEMELVRMVYKNNLLFFRNNAKYAEFLAFKVLDGELHLFSFSTRSSDLFLNTRRVERIKGELGGKGDSRGDSKGVVRSAPAGDLTGGDSDQSDDQSDHSLSDHSSSDHSSLDLSSLHLEDLFKKAINTDTTQFNVFEMTLQISKGVLHKFLLEDSLRVKNFHESARVVSTQCQSECIRSVTVEHPGGGNLKIFSFFDESYVVDLREDSEVVFIYRISEDEMGVASSKITSAASRADPSVASHLVSSVANTSASPANTDAADRGSPSSSLPLHSHLPTSCKLKIFHKPESPAIFPNFFIELVKIKICLLKYFNAMDRVEYGQYRTELRLERYVKPGVLFFQLRTEFEDDFSLVLFSCKKQDVLFEVHKIISSREFTLIYPVESDYIKISVIPKHKKNLFIDYKLKNIENSKDIYLDCRIGLKSGDKLKIRMEGTPSHVIFWEKSFDIPLKSYIEDSERKTDVGACGVVRSEARGYVVVFKNVEGKKRDIDVRAGLVGFY